MPNTDDQDCVRRICQSKKRVERKGLEVSLELLIKIRECFVRANICNQSKLLHDICDL